MTDPHKTHSRPETSVKLAQDRACFPDSSCPAQYKQGRTEAVNGKLAGLKREEENHRSRLPRKDTVYNPI